jgi:hypothetical protein
MRDSAAIIADLNSYYGSDTTWRGLDGLVGELFQSPVSAAGLNALFGVFERHPTHDGFGVFWTILHGIESVPAYEPQLLRSLYSRPSLFAVDMVNRILNAGEREFNGVSWVTVLRQISSLADIEPEIRDQAKKYLETHAGLSDD